MKEVNMFKCLNYDLTVLKLLLILYNIHSVCPYLDKLRFWERSLLIVWVIWVMVFNATINNILVISWRSVLLVEETGVPGENHSPAASHWQTLSHNVVSSTPFLSGIQTHNVKGDRVDRVSEWLLLNTNSAIFQLYHGENKLIINEIMIKSALF
jgi:hypothetical protein